MPVSSLRSRKWLRVARAAWLGYTVLVSVIFVIGVIARFEEMTRLDTYHFGALLEQLGLSLEFFAIYTTSLDLLTAAAFVGIGMIVFWRVRDDWMALVSSLANVNVIMGLLPWIPMSLESGTVWHTLAISLRGFGYFTAILFFYIFPDGRFTPRWTRFFAVLMGLHGLSWLFWPAMIPPMDFGAINILDKLLSLVIALFFMGSGVVAQVVRFRSNTDPVKRLQTRWVLFGSLAVLASFVIVSLPVLIFPELRVPGLPNLIFLLAAIPILIASLIALPITMAVSILRYRLWDIDLIIRRTLVYGILSAVLGLVYLVSVVLLQQALRFLIRANNETAVAVSTLLIAALFSPLRRALQRGIDRRFFRRKYDSVQAVASFSSTSRGNLSLEELNRHLMKIINQTLEPEHASLRLKKAPLASPGNALRNASRTQGE